MINIPSECSRYEKCSVNNCPLHTGYPYLFINEDDAEQVCTMEKNVRLKIGSKYIELLKFGGLTTKEWAAKERYNNLSDEKKEELKNRGKKALDELHKELKDTYKSKTAILTNRVRTVNNLLNKKE